MNIKYTKDINYFLDMYEKNHPAPYYFCSKDSILKYVEEYVGKHKVINDFDFQYLIRTISKRLNGDLDSHTGVRFKHSRFLPIVIKFFDDGLYIVNANDEYKNMIGSKVHKINNILINQLITEIEECYSYNTEGWCRHGIARILSDIEGILMLPSIDYNCNEIVFECSSFDNKQKIISFNLNNKYNLNTKEENYKYYIHNNILVFKYSLCLEEYECQMKDTVNKIKKLIIQNNINKIILDIRNNIGGNSTIIDNFIDYLTTVDMKLVILTNGEVFSSGIDVIQKMKKFDPVFIGEEIGSSINHFGALDCQFYLPVSGIKAVISTKYLLPEKVVKSQDEFKNLSVNDLKKIIFMPDIKVTETLNDFVTNNDSILMAAFNYLDD